MTHPGSLTLRRYLAEEALDAATVAHLKTCGDCAKKLEALRDEQRAFEKELPFERFAAGVEKAARAKASPPPRRWAPVLAALAAGLVVLVGVGLLQRPDESTNRIKGGPSVEFVVNGPGGQRTADELEHLAAGERLRIGVTGHRHVLALSVDDAGEVSMMYAETVTGAGQTWLPDSIEFTGSGREHVVVLLSDQPISLHDARRKLEDAFRAAGGDVTQLKAIEVPGVQVHRTFFKP